jgi:hypothetical protein
MKMRLTMLTLSASLLLAGCSPPAEDSSATNTPPAAPPAAGTNMPVFAAGDSSGAAQLNGRTLTFGKLSAQVPEGWKNEPASGMRVAQFTLPKAAGDSNAPVFIVYYFGANGAGSVEANVKRWKDMVEPQTGTPKEAKTEKDGVRVTSLDASGTFNEAAMGMPGAPPTPHPNYRLLAAVVEVVADAGKNPYYFRMYGPVKSVAAAKSGWDALVASLKVGEAPAQAAAPIAPSGGAAPAPPMAGAAGGGAAPEDPKLKALEARLAKSPDDAKLKAEAADAYAQAGDKMMNDQGLPPRTKYRGALKLFRRAVALNPKQKQAADGIALIEGIYRSMGMPVPE